MEIGQPTRRIMLQLVAGLPAAASAIGTEQGAALLPSRELGLAPGLIHLNTASAGPTPDRVLQRAVAAWHKIETDPVAMSYFADADSVVSAADRVRGSAAALVGCTPDEILLTRGTTDGITTIAHSIRLREGDHVLLTSQKKFWGHYTYLRLGFGGRLCQPIAAAGGPGALYQLAARLAGPRPPSARIRLDTRPSRRRR